MLFRSCPFNNNFQKIIFTHFHKSTASKSPAISSKARKHTSLTDNFFNFNIHHYFTQILLYFYQVHVIFKDSRQSITFTNFVISAHYLLSPLCSISMANHPSFIFGSSKSFENHLHQFLQLHCVPLFPLLYTIFQVHHTTLPSSILFCNNFTKSTPSVHFSVSLCSIIFNCPSILSKSTKLANAITCLHF